MERRPIRSLTALAAAALLLAGCSDGGAESAAQDVAGGEVTSGPADTDDGQNAGADEEADTVASTSGGTFTWGGEELEPERLICFFEEHDHPSGGVQTHSAQATSTDGTGQEVTLDIRRRIHEDGEVTEVARVDVVGDPEADTREAEKSTIWTGDGPDGTIEFSDESLSAEGIELTELDDPEGEMRLLSFDMRC